MQVKRICRQFAVITLKVLYISVLALIQFWFIMEI